MIVFQFWLKRVIYVYNKKHTYHGGRSHEGNDKNTD